ncbi:MAG: hypothetical protein INR71_05095, partial [Terriglobus roseus]|nr:hypothetical protein [Terriglobus roseus]
MALPRLYERVTLKSYPELRYIDGDPEGYGGGSPFSMGLLGLVAGNVAAYVKELRVAGEWRERDVEEFMKGRIPDNSMMLSIAVRGALDRMALLESFWCVPFARLVSLLPVLPLTFCSARWDMHAKPMQTIYQGLALRPTLTALRVKCPNQRITRPTYVVPPIRTLKSLWITDMDPLCYPD